VLQKLPKIFFFPETIRQDSAPQTTSRAAFRKQIYTHTGDMHSSSDMGSSRLVHIPSKCRFLFFFLKQACTTRSAYTCAQFPRKQVNFIMQADKAYKCYLFKLIQCFLKLLLLVTRKGRKCQGRDVGCCGCWY
jgi:hypothetical protein